MQASKLAVLGQVTAGVAHEINQPVAAIRSYVDNAQVLLGRGEIAVARSNLDKIAALTERNGLITQELRSFARESTGKTGSVSVESAISGALLLVAARLRHRGIRLVREGTETGLHVVADRIRLEQVLVNLLQNA